MSELMTYAEIVGRRATRLRYLAKTYRAGGNTAEALRCEAAARRDDAEAGKVYGVPLRETEHPGSFFLDHVPPPIRVVGREESLIKLAQRARERGDWLREQQALRELRQLRATVGRSR